MSEKYQYPLPDGLKTSEIVDVINFYNQIEKAYENSRGVSSTELVDSFNKFRKIIPTKMEQKQLEDQFKKQSGYDSFEIIKQAINSDKKMIKC